MSRLPRRGTGNGRSCVTVAALPWLRTRRIRRWTAAL